MITSDHERVRPDGGEGFADAVTVSFATPDGAWSGLVRCGLTAGGASVLAVLFRGREPVAALVRGDLERPADADWSEFSSAGLRVTIEAPLERWTLAGDIEGTVVDLTFVAVSAPAELGGEVTRLGGMDGYEQLCSVHGTIGGEAVQALGQRGHQWGIVDWGEIELARTVSCWVGIEEGGVMVTSVRPGGARGHDEEASWGALVDRGEVLEVFDPRLSTTYDSDGRQRRAGLELWVGEDDGYPYRAAGEVACGSTLELGQLRLDLAFFRWHAEGRDGIGRYDVLRRA